MQKASMIVGLSVAFIAMLLFGSVGVLVGIAAALVVETMQRNNHRNKTDNQQTPLDHTAADEWQNLANANHATDDFSQLQQRVSTLERQVLQLQQALQQHNIELANTLASESATAVDLGDNHEYHNAAADNTNAAVTSAAVTRDDPLAAAHAADVEVATHAEPDDSAHLAHSAVASNTEQPTTAAMANSSAAAIREITLWDTSSNDDPLQSSKNYLSRAWQWLIGENAMLRAAFLIIFFGVGFLLKYASDRSLLPIEFRLAGVAAAGSTLLALGWRLRHKRSNYALALQGGALGMLYITAFVTLKLYNLLPAGLTLAFLISLGAFGAFLAIRQNALLLAVLASIGGFLAPLLTSTGDGSHVMLFSYYALLNAGILAIAWFKSWRQLNLIGFAFTFSISTLWGALRYEPSQWSSTLPFIVLFFVFYLLIALLYALKRDFEVKRYVDGSLVFGAPLLSFAQISYVLEPFEFALAFASVAYGALYLALAYWLKRDYYQRVPLLFESFLALGVIFSTLAVPLAFGGATTAAIWGVEAAAILWVSLRQQHRLGLYFSMLLQLFASCALVSDWQVLTESALPLLNSNYLAAWLLALACGSCGYLLQRQLTRPLFIYWRYSSYVFSALGLLWLLFNQWQELHRLLAPLDQPAVFIMVSSILALVIGELRQRLCWPLLRGVSLLLIPLYSLYLFGIAISQQLAYPLANFGWLAVALATPISYYLLRQQQLRLQVMGVGHLLLAWGLCALVTSSLSDIVARLGFDNSWESVIIPLTLSLLLLALFTLKPRIRWPLNHWGYHYLFVLPIPLLMVSSIWCVSALRASAAMSPLPYLPLLNPIDIAQAFVLLSGLTWLTHSRRQRWIKVHRLLPYAVVLGCVSLWLSVDVLRLFHHYGGYAYQPELLSFILPQASLVLLWCVICATIEYRLVTTPWQRVLHLTRPALLLVLLGWASLANLHSAAWLQLPYLPLLNPVEWAQLTAFALSIIWLRQLNWRVGELQHLQLVLAGLLFVFINTLLLRVLHHWFDIDYRFNTLMRSMLVQVCLSLYWSVVALILMVWAHKHHSRAFWLGGGALLLLVIAKLFTVDLSQVSGLARIVSFIGVGALLLLISYQAPIPPKKAALESTDDDA